MPHCENYCPAHAYFTPEPHCVPGYTGYLPGFGPHKLYQYGKTYGRLTHDIMERHPVAGDRFACMAEPYPCDSVDAFEKLRRDKSILDYSKYNTAGIDDILPRLLTFPERLCERPKHRMVPSYATFTNPMNYGQSVYDMSDLDPRKTYIPGYTGYYTGKCFDDGVTSPRGAHQDLCDLTSSRLERLVAERRPRVDEWYRCPVLYPPKSSSSDVISLGQFTALPGYTGHIPGLRNCCGQSFGEAAGSILKERELNFTQRAL